MKKMGLFAIITLSSAAMEREEGSKSSSPKESPSTSRISRASRRISTDFNALRERLSRVSNEDLSQPLKDEKIKEFKEKLSKAKKVYVNPVDKEKLLKEIIEHPSPESALVKLDAFNFYIQFCTDVVEINLINMQTHKNLKQLEHVAAAIEVAKKKYYETRKLLVDKLKYENPTKPLYDHEYETDNTLKDLKEKLDTAIIKSS